MDKKILLDNNAGDPGKPDIKNNTHATLNLFQGRTEAENSNAVFPEWDIVPPSQFINPRIKQR
ncbi:MAG: hypothetical protein EOO00_05075 [Chitinophagaceae bacterium]|nr:MAG: hypothetical protein EOO00_05075 [Chitinophagaceae bacterium]